MEFGHGILIIERHDSQIRPVCYNWMPSVGFRLQNSSEHLKSVSITRSEALAANLGRRKTAANLYSVGRGNQRNRAIGINLENYIVIDRGFNTDL